MNKKKYILTMIVILQICAILFVASYAWFHSDTLNKKVEADELKISATEDLIMKYKGVTYSALRLNDVVSTHFMFDQVSSTGLGDQFYKIDYTPKLSEKPAKYIEATANEDYLSMEISLTASSKGKRVYLDGTNSGFVIGEAAGDPLKNDTSAIDCMRMSLSFVDNDNNQRYIVFANKEYKNYVILDDDLLGKDSLGNPIYSSGKPFIINYAETAYGQNAITPTGIENALKFTRYDLAVDENGTILFDLAANQTKKITINIWLDGTAAFLDSEGNDFVSGRPITCSLRFSSTNEITTEMSSKIVKSGMEINTINEKYELLADKLTNSGTGLNKFVVPYTSKYYALKDGTYTISGNTLIYNFGSITRNYSKITIDGKSYYYDATREDKLYYDLSNVEAYVKYSDLNWTLKNDVAKSMPNPTTGVQTDVTLGTLNSSTKKITVGNGTIGDTFNLIGYVTLSGEQVNVVNETYVFGKVVEVLEYEPVGIKDTNELYLTSFISSLYESEGGFSININGVNEVIYYSDYEHFIWRVENYSSSVSSRTPLTVMNGSVEYRDGLYYLKQDPNTNLFVDLEIDTSNADVNDTFYLLGCYKDGSYQEVVVKILFYIHNN